MLLEDREYDEVWDRVYKELKFHPSCEDVGHSLDAKLPFEINLPHSIYAIDEVDYNQWDVSSEDMDRIITECFIKSTDESILWYALDWHHSAFKFNPRNNEERQSVLLEETFEMFGRFEKVYADFPDFFPDGDYCFFIDENFENGYLAHPWRCEVWIFGSKLQNEFEKVVDKLGWRLIAAKR